MTEGALVAALSAVSCSLPPVESSEAAVDAWMATAHLIDMADGSLREQHMVSEAAGDQVSVDQVIACPEGGEMRFDGDYMVYRLDDAESGTHYEVVGYHANIAFDACVADSLRIDGALAVVREPLIDDVTGGFIDLTTDFVGDLEWRGEVRGHCSIDMSVDSQSGSGDLCEYDAYDAYPGA